MMTRDRTERRAGGVRLAGPLFLILLGVAMTSCGDNDVSGPSGNSGTATPDASATATAVGPLVATYFYYWYDLPDGPHSTELTDRPTEADASYKSVDWFEKQFLDMRDAGIDVALAVYWGRIEPSSDVGLANMATAYDQIDARGESSPAIAMFLDTGAIGQWPVSQRDLTRPENQERVYSMIRTFYEIVPQHQWLILDGRPLVWLWAAWFDITFDQSFFDYVISSFESDFGVRPYIVGEEVWRLAVTSGGVDPSQQMPLDDFYIWGASLTGFVDPPGGVAQIGPGFDERELAGAGRSGRYREREDGEFYELSFEQAIQSGSWIIAIETWNEFHEASDIADSVEFGREYIDLTREWVDRFKAVRAP